MKRRVVILLTLMSVGYYVGCAPVKFEKDTNCGDHCIELNGLKTYRYSIIPNSGKVDILFVDDNSSSMSTEQNAVAARFQTFIQALDARSIDYRIAIATTDIEKDNGKLATFGSGINFLTPTTASKETLFSNAIRREETLSCDLNKTNCPSNDERGIFAAHSIVKTNPAGFIRPEAHLAVVFLADEDVRSQVYDKYSSYALASEDLPQTLISAVQSTYSSKSFSAHAIIVKPGTLNGISAAGAAARIASGAKARDLFSEGDYNCLVAQARQTVSDPNQAESTATVVERRYGYLYALAARMTGGVEGSICESDYGSQLYRIGENIGEQIFEHTLNCADPVQIDSETPMATFTPAGGAHKISGDKMTFSPNLSAGTKAYLQYSCAK